MREKIARRIRRELIRRGVVFGRESFYRPRGEKRKECGMTVRAEINGWKISAIAHDRLEAYKMLLEDLEWLTQRSPEDMKEDGA